MKYFVYIMSLMFVLVFVGCDKAKAQDNKTDVKETTTMAVDETAGAVNERECVKGEEHKCVEGKCCKEKCAGDETKEHKCVKGECCKSKYGRDKTKDAVKEHKCGEGKCGEGKCGGDKTKETVKEVTDK
jgi:uncharacterized low-complexity protein